MREPLCLLLLVNLVSVFTLIPTPTVSNVQLFEKLRWRSVFIEPFLVDRVTEPCQAMSLITGSTAAIPQPPGSGVIIGSNLLMTARHITGSPGVTNKMCYLIFQEGSNDIRVATRMHNEPTRNAVLENVDLDLLSFFPPFPLEDSCFDVDSRPSNGPVQIPAFPDLQNDERLGMLTEGLVPKIRFGSYNLVQDCGLHSLCKVEPKVPAGFSGGPVWNTNGELIGLVVSTETVASGTTIVQPVGHLENTLEHLTCGQVVTRTANFQKLSKGSSNGVRIVIGGLSEDDIVAFIDLEIIDFSLKDAIGEPAAGISVREVQCLLNAEEVAFSDVPLLRLDVLQLATKDNDFFVVEALFGLAESGRQLDLTVRPVFRDLFGQPLDFQEVEPFEISIVSPPGGGSDVATSNYCNQQ